MLNNSFLRPPGTYYDVYEHPKIGSSKAIEVATVQDHRFAFFYWLKWTNKLNQESIPTPSLISLDWHDDLAHPDGHEREELKVLNTKNYKEVALFCWDNLNQLNDGHVLSAAYLNLVGDIHVVQKQHESTREFFEDIHGNSHTVNCYVSVAELMQELSNLRYSSIYFDIDLDYFTESPDSDCGGGNVELVSEQEIQEILNINGDFVSWVFQRLEGMTIATEPEFCGGMTNSNRLFAAVSNIFLDPPFLNIDSKWKHLSE